MISWALGSLMESIRCKVLRYPIELQRESAVFEKTLIAIKSS